MVPFGWYGVVRPWVQLAVAILRLREPDDSDVSLVAFYIHSVPDRGPTSVCYSTTTTKTNNGRLPCTVINKTHTHTHTHKENDLSLLPSAAAPRNGEPLRDTHQFVYTHVSLILKSVG
ncbi:hypothetical protein OUZ56_023320 [Daphnia magna]|uniref:Uncharacterized protein n=1 Tax=Daphnia magna TaxID=35525 RepID=A0ABR0AZ63_9CRUS|nr:hypothetical protein OUZ56_023320 [Daphnia magna]